MKSQEQTYLQCQCCGNVFVVSARVDIEELYVNTYPCPRCVKRHALNVGENSYLDYYELYNVVMDERYY